MSHYDPTDPHDELMLTERPTTVVTQGTGVYDRMPTLYGTVHDEERLWKHVRRPGKPVRRSVNRRPMLRNGKPVARAPRRAAPRGMFEGLGYTPELSQQLTQAAADRQAEADAKKKAMVIGIGAGVAVGLLLMLRRR